MKVVTIGFSILTICAWSWPLGAEETFMVFTDGNGVLRTDLSGNNDQQLTLDPTDKTPRISPDGSTIVFWRGLSLFTIKSDGTEPQLLLPAAATGIARHLCWSPTGTRIAFAEGAVGTNNRLHIINADGTGHEVIHMESGRDFGQPPHCDWSLDEQWIYISLGQSANVTALDIFACATDGSGCAPVTDHPGSALAEFPALSSAKDKLFFARRLGSQRSIVRAELDGSAPETLLTISHSLSTTEASGGRLYYTAAAGGDFQLYSMLENGTDIEQHSTRAGGIDAFPHVFIDDCSFGPLDAPLTFRRGYHAVSWDSCGGPGELFLDSQRVFIAWVWLNGELIFQPLDFIFQGPELSTPVELQDGENAVDVLLLWKRDGVLAIDFLPGS